MLLDTVTLILHETLEAGMLLCVLVSISAQRKFSLGWLWLAIVMGVLTSVLYAMNFGAISQAFEYAGQELLNATMRLASYVCLLATIYMLIFHPNRRAFCMKVFMAFAVIIVMALELTEIVIFYTGFLQSGGDPVSGLTSGFVGLTIGMSLGVMSFVLITLWSPHITRTIQIVMLSLVSAGMIIQVAQLLMQIDWLITTETVWDSNWLINEPSIVGQMSSAIFGYEATPTILEACAYLITLILVAMLGVSKNVFMNKVNR